MVSGSLILFFPALVLFLLIVLFFIRVRKLWMLGILLSVLGFVGVIVTSALLCGRIYPFDDGVLISVVFFSLSLAAGLVMTIQGLKKS